MVDQDFGARRTVAPRCPCCRSSRTHQATTSSRLTERVNARSIARPGFFALYVKLGLRRRIVVARRRVVVARRIVATPGAGFGALGGLM